MTTPDAARIRAALGPHAAERLERFEVFREIDSTNSFLKDQPPPSAGNAHVAIAGHQTAGRGRRDRRWVSKPGDSVCLSVSYSFKRLPDNLPAVTLAIGVGIVGALDTLGANGVRLKWPNDLMAENKKLGGVLTETQFKDRDAVSVIAGIGINLGEPDLIAGVADNAAGNAAGNAVGEEVGDWRNAAIGLHSLLPAPPSPETVMAALIDAALTTFFAYERDGFDRVHPHFESLDWLAEQHVVVEVPDGEVEGIARGIDTTGALLVDDGSERIAIVSGSIRRASLPPMPPIATIPAVPA